MKRIVYILLFCFCFSAKGQVNLVPNPSFEMHSSCPSGPGQLIKATPWIGIPINEADYFNSCSTDTNFSVPYQGPYNFQAAKTGNAYVGILTFDSPGVNYREYAQIQLTTSLQVNTCYYVEFFANRASGSFGGNYATNNIECSFTNSAVTNTGTGYVLNLTPHIVKFGNPIIIDTMKWTKVSGVFVSTGGEDFLTIGNFSNDANTDTLNLFDAPILYPSAYYFIDDVSVIPIDSIVGGMPANAGHDTSLVSGDSVFIGQQITGLNCNWYNASGTLIASNTSGIYVHPTSNTHYVVEQNLCGTITYDTVNVNVTYLGITENTKPLSFTLSPNPNNGNMVLNYTIKPNDKAAMKIYDVAGKLVEEYDLNSNNNQFQIAANLDKGIYLYRIIVNDSVAKSDKIVIIK